MKKKHKRTLTIFLICPMNGERKFEFEEKRYLGHDIPLVILDFWRCDTHTGLWIGMRTPA